MLRVSMAFVKPISKRRVNRQWCCRYFPRMRRIVLPRAGFKGRRSCPWRRDPPPMLHRRRHCCDSMTTACCWSVSARAGTQGAGIDAEPLNFRRQPGVFDLGATIHHDFDAGSFRFHRGFVVSDAKLHPDHFRQHRQCQYFIDHGHRAIRVANTSTMSMGRPISFSEPTNGLPTRLLPTCPGLIGIMS